MDWLKEAGQSYWQILPLGPTSYGDSPYQSFSTYAGNPYFISLEALIEEGVLSEEECAGAEMGAEPSAIDYKLMYEERYPLLRKAYERSDISRNQEYVRFVEENAWWLKDYALFMAVKGRFGGAPWTEWAEDIRLRWNNAMDYYREELYFDIEFQQYLQFVFYRQWYQLKNYANGKGVQLIGDIPIYVAMDSADVWANPGLFQLDETNTPVAVAGCPPDGFAADGQLWGNPLYRWDVMKKDNYAWWTMRMKRTLAQVDIVRLDHFRGFEAYWRVDANEKTAINGKWVKGPCEDLFIALEKACGKLPVIAEDLGTITDEVNELRMKLGLPGMKILHFDLDTQSEVPLRAPKNSVLYTGTHDNNTTVGWLTEDLTPRDRDAVRRALMRTVGDETSDARLAIRFAYASNADTVIVPMQDVLELGTTARMNLPGTIEGNWSWRMPKGSLTQERADFLRGITNEYDR